MSAARKNVPDLLLEQYALGELSRGEKAGLDALLESDPDLRRRLESLRASDVAILSESPPAEIAASIRRRMLSSGDGPSLRGARRPGAPWRTGAPRRRGAAFKPLSAILLPVAAAVLVLAGAIIAKPSLFPGADDLSRPKGAGPGLFVFTKGAQGVDELRDGDVVAAGRLLQIRYGAAAPRFGAIFSLDGRGAITRHLPVAAARTDVAATPAGGRAPAPRLAEAGAALGSAYELDDAPGFERFFIVSSPRGFDLEPVETALRELAAAGPGAATQAPRLPGGLEWKSLLLRKPEAER